jgi:hypothetical protein
MTAMTLALVLAPLALAAFVAFFVAPARNAALGAWSLAAWRRRRPSDPGSPGRPPS